MLQKSVKRKRARSKSYLKSRSDKPIRPATHVIPVVCVYACVYFGCLSRHTCAYALRVFVQFLFLPIFACDNVRMFFELIYFSYYPKIVHESVAAIIFLYLRSMISPPFQQERLLTVKQAPVKRHCLSREHVAANVFACIGGPASMDVYSF